MIICHEYIKGIVTTKKESDYTKDRIKYALEELIKLYGYAPNVEVGDFTYGLPILKWWGEKTNLRIGKFCSIAKDVTIFLGGEHETSTITTYPFFYYIFEWDGLNEIEEAKIRPSKGNIVIGNDVWIGANTMILSGVTISDGAVIGAGSVISKDIPPYSIVAGNPSKVIRQRFSPEEIKILMQLKWWDWDMKKINSALNLLLSSDLEGLISFNNEYNSNNTPLSKLISNKY